MTLQTKPNFEKALTRFQNHFNPLLDERLNTLEVEETIVSAMKYSTLSTGKRLRAFLTWEVARNLKGDLKLAETAALAVEYMHTFSLIHDDLPAMDDDDLRRGKPSCHIAFSEGIAILAGDALQTFAFEILTDGDQAVRLPMIKSLARHSGAHGMAGGQAIDISNTEHALDSLLNMYRKKTADLLIASAELGLLCTPEAQNADKLRAIKKYALNIGLAFQIHDDTLDVIQNSETLGKPAGSDIRQNKSTAVSILGLTEAKALAEHYYHAALSALDIFDGSELWHFLNHFARYIIRRDF